MSVTPTMMGTAQAKAVIGLSGPPAWREAGHSGKPSVVHEQGRARRSLRRLCPLRRGPRRLAVSSLPEAFHHGLQMLVTSQFVQLFGKAL